MSQRTDRVAGEIQSALGEILSRQAIKDPRVREAGLLTVTRIEVSGDLRHAKVFFTVFGAAQDVLEKAEAGLDHAAAFLQREVARRIRLRLMPQLHFTVDRGYEGAARVDALFRTLENERRQRAAPGGAEGAAEDEEGEGGAGGEAPPPSSGDVGPGDSAPSATAPAPGQTGASGRRGDASSPDPDDVPASADPGSPGTRGP